MQKANAPSHGKRTAPRQTHRPPRQTHLPHGKRTPPRQTHQTKENALPLQTLYNTQIKMEMPSISTPIRSTCSMSFHIVMEPWLARTMLHTPCEKKQRRSKERPRRPTMCAFTIAVYDHRREMQDIPAANAPSHGKRTPARQKRPTQENALPPQKCFKV